MTAPDVAIWAILVKIVLRVDEGMRIMDPTDTNLSIILKENIPLAIGHHSHDSLKTFLFYQKQTLKCPVSNFEAPI